MASESANDGALLGHAQDCKTRGNAEYARADYDAAAASYTDGLEWLIDPVDESAGSAEPPVDPEAPSTPTEPAPDSPSEPIATVAPNPDAAPTPDAAPSTPDAASTPLSSPSDPSAPPPDPTELERKRYAARFRPAFRSLASVLLSNRAACHLQHQKYEETKSDCDLSLELDPKYAKAMLRRAKANEALTKLSDALADYQAALAIDGSLSEAREAARTLPARIKEQQEKEKEEMIGKLKELGNSVLGWFGLSTDNFKFVQDPKTGGYSVNFQQ
eukprot:TRINITY_DN18874_c0_g1_i1.p2 TRINITY_DN18874_c0_g1~~TRINITY_DN18874_c0_g1_i1.p2  ORF type:complete len:273 (-),score=107.76 TRINITY_DN18874_c0_g1_i1:217-1035(-)